MTDQRSPKITAISWGEIEIDVNIQGKDYKVWPGGARPWDWNETHTRHVPGIQIGDVKELVDQGCTHVVLSRGMHERLQTKPETIAYLENKGIEVTVIETRQAVAHYNTLAEAGEKVGGLFHSTC